MNKIKVSDLVASFIEKIGTTVVFGVSGGASLHLLASIKNNPHLSLVPMHHEQSVAMAAETYSRITGKIGIGIVTSGPGATNLVTGIAGSFYDSVPTIFITGQVSTSRMKGSLGVRQVGFQETPITKIVEDITKYAVTVTDPNMVASELIAAYNHASEGRPGPVLVDIPDDIQRMFTMSTDFESLSKVNSDTHSNLDFRKEIEQFENLILNAKRPVIIFGSGLKAAKNKKKIIQSVISSKIPVALTWGAFDLMDSANPLLLGTFGTHGNRAANLCIQESDLIISIGARLDLKATGSPPETFASNAKKVMFDIDLNEIDKFKSLNVTIDLGVCLNLESRYFENFLTIFQTKTFVFSAWNKRISEIKAFLRSEPRKFSRPGVNPYEFIKALSEKSDADLNLVLDTGCTVAWTMQAWKLKLGQKVFHDFNNTAMGWSIPAAVASSIIESSRKTFCLVGDGSIMMSLGDLATLRRNSKNTKIFLLNNGGYSMIKQTQDQWFDSKYFASDAKYDLLFPNFELIANAFGFNYVRISQNEELNEILGEALESDKPTFCEVVIQEDARVVPIVKFGSPNYVMNPEL